MEQKTPVPVNDSSITDLERAIADFADAGDDHEGQARRNVLAQLSASRVFTLFAEPVPKEAPPGSRIQLQMVSDGPDTGQPMVAVFTSSQRAEDFMQQQGMQRHRDEVPGLWAILATAPSAGLLINPNQPLSFRIAPELARFLREDAASAAAERAEQSGDGESDS